MKKLICFQLSVILAFSPLAAQDNKYAKIFSRYGVVAEGTILYFDEHRVDFLLKGTGSNYGENRIPLEQIYILQDSDSNILIHNLENKEDFFKGFSGDIADLDQFVSAETQLYESLISFIPNSSKKDWFIVLNSGEDYRYVVIEALVKDSLKIRIVSESNVIHLAEISGIYSVRELKIESKKTENSANNETNNRFAQGAYWGGIAGLGLGLVGVISLTTGECKDGCLGLGLILIVLVTVLPVVGAIGGGTINYLAGKTNEYSEENIKQKSSIIEKSIIEKNRMIFNMLVAQDQGEPEE